MCLVLRIVCVMGPLVGLLQPVRKSWTFVLRSAVCLNQLGRARLLCGVRNCGAVVEEETVLEGKCVGQWSSRSAV